MTDAHRRNKRKPRLIARNVQRSGACALMSYVWRTPDTGCHFFMKSLYTLMPKTIIDEAVVMRFVIVRGRLSVRMP